MIKKATNGRKRYPRSPVDFRLLSVDRNQLRTGLLFLFPMIIFTSDQL
jgi:hypothetical protein